ncbi:1-acyl-sn-glycerol-3-phosphate acyltransferase [Croceicoccus ponticola]|uniref:1-acyl-sn-glycerol-3-phosphate acyltransferase n=1 Tax=Croceicoccus ponticola TaxID=2217664 RepID=A0A437GYT6_9SPHN|nr:1-acyl-sn-glycerol-3-phosphate acyltransferase [Croceicoccus ponticola]
MSQMRSAVFAVTFYVGSFLIIMVTVPALILPRGFVFGIARVWSWYHRQCCRFVLGYRIVVEGTQPKEQALYAIKHESFFEAIDAPTFTGGPVIPFAKIELMRIPVWGRAARQYGVIGVDRDTGAQAIRQISRAARELKPEGRDFVIFPEGTRIPHNQPGTLQAGLYAVYKILGLPLVPVAVDSGPLYQTKPKRSGTITYRIGEVVPPGLSRDEMEARVFAAINALNDLPETTA